MEGLVAGSHNSGEILVIPRERVSSNKESKHLSRKICYICGDDVGLTVDGELFVACNECAFPICRTCYEYERMEGNQVCPQCKTRFKRLKGCARVDGDEEEDDFDDLENEFSLNGMGNREDMFHASTADASTRTSDQPHVHPKGQHSVLSNGKMVDDSNIIFFNKLDDTDLDQDASVFLSAAPSPAPPSVRSLDPSKDLDAYGYGTVAWKARMDNLETMKADDGSDDVHSDDIDHMASMDEARQPLSRKVPISASQITPYRMSIIIQLVVLGFFIYFRVTHPVNDAYALWAVSVICEIWFSVSWILYQFPKCFPVDRETYLDRLSLTYEKEGQLSQLSHVDIFVTTVNPSKEPPLIIANTVLSILALDYPVHKVTCYVSDDAASIITFEVLSETSEFAKKWVPFCKKFSIEPRAPEWYFAQKIDYLNNKVLTSFVRERRGMKREYQEFKVRINNLVAKARKVPEEGWTMQDGFPWPGNNINDHPGMIQVFLGQSGGHNTSESDLPGLIYVSREKKPTFNHHRRAGAMNALVRVSSVLTNAPYILNLNCNHYINNSKALKEAMCFMMDPLQGKRVCFVQFPQRLDAIYRYSNSNTMLFDINMKGLDGIQGPMYVGSGCVFRRQALYGYEAPKSKKPLKRTSNRLSNWCIGCFCWGNRKKMKYNKVPKVELMTRDTMTSPLFTSNMEGTEGNGENYAMPEQKLEKKFGLSSFFIASTFLEDGGTLKGASCATLLNEAMHVISCGYEDKTEWGKEVGWIYGSATEDMLTGFKMHCQGWRSIYCVPDRAAFMESAPISLSDNLHQVLKWSLGSIELFFSRNCPIWYGYGGDLKFLERLAYFSATVYPWTSIPLVAYCTLPAMCLVTGKFITTEPNKAAGLWFLSLFFSIFATNILEMRWSGVSIDEWWRNQQFWLIGGVSSRLFAIFQGLLKVTIGVDRDFHQLHSWKLTILLIPPTTLLLINLIGIVVSLSSAINHGFDSWGPLVGKLVFASCVVAHLFPFLKGLMGGGKRTPTIIMLWSVLLASIFSSLWVDGDPFLSSSNGLALEECGLDCY